MNILPINGYILIEPIKEEEVTKSGIVLPGNEDREKSQEGIVVAGGGAPKSIDQDGIKPGSKVLYGQFAGEDVKIDGKNYKFVHIDSIRAIIL